MAKKKKDSEFDNYEEKEKVGSKIVSILIALVIVFMMLSVFALLIKLDVGGFGNNVLRPVLKDVPIINKVLPTVPEEQVAEEKNYPYKNLGEAIDRIKELETQLELVEANANDTRMANETTIVDLQAEIDRLKVFEKNQLEFESKVKEFETNVVFNENAPNIEEYKKYYESINPTNAEEIYRQVVEQIEFSKKVKEFAKTFSSMKPENAAPILETMTADLDLVSKILMNMKPAQRAEILAEMDATAAAKITKKMSADNMK